MNHLVAPSILAADFIHLERDIQMVNDSVADWLHVDIMDGHFVPNISFGHDITAQIAKISKKPLDVHLMIEDPDRYIENFVNAGSFQITVHYEACRHLNRTLQSIGDYGIKAGVAINPHTPVSVIENVLEMVDLVIIMSVNPGFGGQKFIYQSLSKIGKVRSMIDRLNAKAMIEVDGGVGLQNAEKVLQAGANVLVAGSSVFRSENPNQTINRLKSIGKVII